MKPVTMMQPVDPALSLVAIARDAEAAQVAFLSAGGVGPDSADDAIYDACVAVPTTLAGMRAKLAMLVDIEGPNLSEEAILTIRSCLASPVLAVLPT